MRMRRIALNQRGSAVVEFVLVAPLVILVFAAVAQICLASYVRSTLIACAAEGPVRVPNKTPTASSR